MWLLVWCLVACIGRQRSKSKKKRQSRHHCKQNRFQISNWKQQNLELISGAGSSKNQSNPPLQSNQSSPTIPEGAAGACGC
jgi:hypothetical protein